MCVVRCVFSCCCFIRSLLTLCVVVCCCRVCIAVYWLLNVVVCWCLLCGVVVSCRIVFGR